MILAITFSIIISILTLLYLFKEGIFTSFLKKIKLSAINEERNTFVNLVHQTAYSGFIRESVGNRTDTKNFLDLIYPIFQDYTSFVGKKVKRELKNIIKQLAKKKNPVSDEGFRKLLTPVCNILPQWNDYIQIISKIPLENRAEIIEKKYRKAKKINDPFSDELAFNYILILKSLGENDMAIKILKERLITASRNKNSIDYELTLDVGEEILGEGGILTI